MLGTTLVPMFRMVTAVVMNRPELSNVNTLRISRGPVRATQTADNWSGEVVTAKVEAGTGVRPARPSLTMLIFALVGVVYWSSQPAQIERYGLSKQ